MTNPELLFTNVEVLQKQLKEAQKSISVLQAKINDVPPEKILKYVLIGLGIGVLGCYSYRYLS